jgi:hypothetical protein
VTVVVALAFLVGFLLSPRLWLSTRSYPLVPPLGWFPPVPKPLDHIWFGGLLLLSGAIVLFPRRRRLLLAFVVLTGLYCLGDQTRWQPWVYEYLLLFIALAGCSRSAEDAARREACLNTCRLIVAATYFWSGVAKVHVTFATDVFPWLVDPVLPSLPQWFPIDLVGYGVPFIEISIGIGLLVRPTRSVAACLAVMMHLFILASIGPLGHNWNSIVWPWNIASTILVVLLFFRCRAAPQAVLWPGGFPFARVVLLLVGVLPGLNIVGCWDSYLSMSLYSGDVLDAELQLPAAAADRLPADALPHLREQDDGKQSIDVADWCIADLNVPPYPARRTFLALARRVAQMTDAEEEVILVIRERPGFFHAEREETRYEISAADHHRLGPGGRNSSLTLCWACSESSPANHGSTGFFPGGYSDSIGPQTASTRSSNRSPMSRSVTVPFSCGKVRTKWPKLKPS